MQEKERIFRIVRKRRARTGKLPHLFSPLGTALALTGAALLAGGVLAVILPLPPPGPTLVLGSRPQPARFYDRTGRMILEAGSSRASESRWYSIVGEDAGGCALAAFLSARGLTREDLEAKGFLEPVGTIWTSLSGGNNLAEESAGELLAMNGRRASAWDRIRLSAALAARYDRRALAEWLLNVRSYGRNAIGIDDAALTYFGAHAEDLSADQCAALEALGADPSLAKDAAGLKKIRDRILSRMLNAGFLPAAEWQESITGEVVLEPVGTGFPPENMGGSAEPGGTVPFLGSYLQLAAGRLADRYPARELPRSGIRVFTSLDLDLELQTLCAAQNMLSMPEDGPGGNAIRTLVGEPCNLAGLLGPSSSRTPPADLALAVIDPESGELLAYFDSARGGESVAAGPVGSSLLPFVYLSAFTGGFTPASMLLDIPRAGVAENPDGKYLGPVSARAALQQRRLAAADGMAVDIGADHLARTLRILGLADSASGGSTLLETMDRPVELVELTRTYALLAAGGAETEDPGSGMSPVILRVENSVGGILEDCARRQTRRIISADLAYLLQDILSDESGRTETAPALAGSHSQVAAVLGEDASAQAAWAFAFTPKFAIGVRGVGNPPDSADARTSWMLTQAVAGWALRSLPENRWVEPPGIVRQDVCVPSGLLPSRYCPAVASEIFLAGTEPSQIDTYYRPVAVNRETGRLATLWTPLPLVEERVYFTLSGDARVWAEQSGFPVPPDTYDTLPDSFPYYEDLHFTAPTALEVLRGKVTVRGSAAVSGMSYFQVQAGPGLYPTVWYSLGTGKDRVSEGVLAEWDTAGKEGVWSLQIIAAQADGTIRTVEIPVTLDNSPPEIRWIEPRAPKHLSISGGSPLILQVEVVDNLALDRVDFYLDGSIRTRLEQGPFSVRWSGLAAGRHAVKICAQDRAGNENCTVEIAVDAS